MSLVTCIMPTANRRHLVPAAIRLFQAQDYPEKELVIVDDGADCIDDLIPDEQCIRHSYLGRPLRLGSKRNLACDLAHGDIIVHWDDDDWHAPWRLSYQVRRMEESDLDLCGLDRALFVDAEAELAWEYVHPPSSMPWLCGATLCYRKKFWEAHPFGDVNAGEDSRFVFSARGARIGILESTNFFVARIHRHNSCPKRPRDGRWRPVPINELRSLLGCDWIVYFGGKSGLPILA